MRMRLHASGGEDVADGGWKLRKAAKPVRFRLPLPAIHLLPCQNSRITRKRRLQADPCLPESISISTSARARSAIMAWCPSLLSVPRRTVRLIQGNKLCFHDFSSRPYGPDILINGLFGVDGMGSAMSVAIFHPAGVLIQSRIIKNGLGTGV